MKTIKLLLVALIVAMANLSFAQKISISKGSLSKLKGQKVINVEYDWSNPQIGKFKNEQDYLDKKSKEYDAKEPGRGDKWKEAWNGDKVARFQPDFEKLFNKHATKAGIYLGNEKVAKYTMIVKTTFIEPGFNVVVSRKSAKINLEIKIVETENKSNVICTIVSKDNPGRSMGFNDYDTGLRISEAYALAGKKMAAFVSKAVK